MLVLSESFKNKLLPMNGYMKGGSDSDLKPGHAQLKGHRTAA